MKYLAYILATFAICTSACRQDPLDISNQPLSGTIASEPWSSNASNAYRLSTSNQYQIRFLTDQVQVSDPCILPNPSAPHIRAILRLRVGSYTVSPQAIDANQVQIAFQPSPSKTLIAAGGFMDIYDIDGGVISGYLRAVEGISENEVEGTFRIRLCN